MRFINLLCATALAFSVGCDSANEPTKVRSASADELQQLCVQCHGAHLEGNSEALAPAIAGLAPWYIKGQLEKFKSGIRGTHFDDIGGMRMRPMTLSLTDEDLETIAQRVGSMSAHKPDATLAGDAERGRSLFATCAACHGPAAGGVEPMKAPPLNHGSDWYLLTQLKNFKAGVRGTNPDDTSGAQMRPMAQNLPDEQAMKDVIAYIGTLN